MSTLRDEIIAKCPPELLATRDAQAIADAASIGRTRLVETKIGEAVLLNVLGPVAGAALLDRLAELGKSAEPQLRPIYYAVGLLKADKLDVGSPATRGQLDALAAAGILPASAVAVVKALAERPDPVSEYDVRRIGWSDDGEWTL